LKYLPVDLPQVLRCCTQAKQKFGNCFAFLDGKAAVILKNLGLIIKKPERIDPAEQRPCVIRKGAAPGREKYTGIADTFQLIVGLVQWKNFVKKMGHLWKQGSHLTDKNRGVFLFFKEVFPELVVYCF